MGRLSPLASLVRISPLLQTAATPVTASDRRRDRLLSSMGVVIETDEQWQPTSLSYVFLFVSCVASVILLPYSTRSSSSRGASSSSSSLFDVGPTAPFLRFQRSFLFLYSLASVMEGLQLVIGDYEFAYYGISEEEIVLYLSVAAALALLIGSFSGILSDVIGARKACLLFCILHLLVGILKNVSGHPSVWLISVCLAFASSLFSFCFETWMVTEHEKQGHRQDLLTDTFWLMTLHESASFIGSQGLANLLVKDIHKGFLSSSVPAAILAIISIIYIRKVWKAGQHTSNIGSYRKSFYAHILNDKRVWMLAWAQASVYFSMSIFWIVWAPTIVADGREVHLSLIYPCFLGSKMLGSTVFAWLSGGSFLLGSEDCLITAFVIAGLALSVVAYDYQEIGVLVVLFCIFHVCIGFILPSLARLRTLFVPNELRGGMVGLSLAPANAGLLFVLLQGGYHRNISNSVIIASSAFGLLTAAGCIHVLRWWRKHPRENWHKL